MPAPQHYRLPCDCGREFVVSPIQAGEVLTCSCGRAREVPTLRAIKKLPLSDLAPAPGARTRRWTVLQGAIFNLGLVVSLLSLATIAFFGWQRTKLDLRKPGLQDDEMLARVMELTPSQAWSAWVAVRDRELADRYTPAYLQARRVDRKMARIIWASAILTALGLGGIAIALAMNRD